MNFSPFGSHFPASIPPIHQFSTKFTHDSSVTNDAGGGGGGGGVTVVNGVASQTSAGNGLNDEGMVGSPPPARYQNHYNSQTGNMPQAQVKYQRDSSTQVSGNMIPVSPPPNAPTKYASNDNVHHYATNIPDVYTQQQQAQQLNHNQQQQKRPPSYHNDNNIHGQEMQGNNVKQEEKEDGQNGEYSTIIQQQQPPGMPPTWQSIATPGSTVADYLSHLPASTLPISLHHFLKYSAESIKKDAETTIDQPLLHQQQQQQPQEQQQQQQQQGPPSPAKKKKKKKVPKEKKPRPKPGEIRLTTALDGSTLYCCPECHMAYPDKSLLEQHLLGHTMERRFFCDICGAGLKRKDHLTRHKQSHNPDRPFVCTVCMKAFKRKEQLTLHFVIHSGEKRHVCPECGKGFYRKDHLRKHTRSHIARRVKAELSQHVPANANANANQSAGDNQPMSS